MRVTKKWRKEKVKEMIQELIKFEGEDALLGDLKKMIPELPLVIARLGAAAVLETKEDWLDYISGHGDELPREAYYRLYYLWENRTKYNRRSHETNRREIIAKLLSQVSNRTREEAAKKFGVSIRKINLWREGKTPITIPTAEERYRTKPDMWSRLANEMPSAPLSKDYNLTVRCLYEFLYTRAKLGGTSKRSTKRAGKVTIFEEGRKGLRGRVVE